MRKIALYAVKVLQFTLVTSALAFAFYAWVGTLNIGRSPDEVPEPMFLVVPAVAVLIIRVTSGLFIEWASSENWNPERYRFARKLQLLAQATVILFTHLVMMRAGSTYATWFPVGFTLLLIARTFLTRR